jgi:hypothetical protein
MAASTRSPTTSTEPMACACRRAAFGTRGQRPGHRPRARALARAARLAPAARAATPGGTCLSAVATAGAPDPGRPGPPLRARLARHRGRARPRGGRVWSRGPAGPRAASRRAPRARHRAGRPAPRRQGPGLEWRAMGREIEKRLGETFLETVPDGFRGRVQDLPESTPYLAVTDGQRFARAACPSRLSRRRSGSVNRTRWWPRRARRTRFSARRYSSASPW